MTKTTLFPTLGTRNRIKYLIICWFFFVYFMFYDFVWTNLCGLSLKEIWFKFFRSDIFINLLFLIIFIFSFVLNFYELWIFKFSLLVTNLIFIAQIIVLNRNCAFRNTWLLTLIWNRRKLTNYRAFIKYLTCWIYGVIFFKAYLRFT